jgi:hypothetical protein
LCIDAVLERNRNRVHGESIQMWLYSFIFQPTKYSPEVYHCVCRSFGAHDKANENSSPELKNIPNWIVGLTELHEKSIKNRMRGGNKSYNNWVYVNVHLC